MYKKKFFQTSKLFGLNPRKNAQNTTLVKEIGRRMSDRCASLITQGFVGNWLESMGSNNRRRHY